MFGCLSRSNTTADDEEAKQKLHSEVFKRYPPVPAEVRKTSRSAVIGGSGVVVAGKERYSVETPFGLVVNVSFLDEDKEVLFLNRHLSTHLDTATGEVRYAPPHEANFQAIVWCLYECGVKRVVALSSTGSLQPEDVPVGSVVMPNDFYMVKPEPTTFWPHAAMGAFSAEASKGQFGRIHYAPAIKEDTSWVSFCAEVQKMIHPVLEGAAGSKVRLSKQQTQASWPSFVLPEGALEPAPCVYVNTVGPRFETRAEIRSYRGLGGTVVGMTCGYEWILCSELMLPYALVSVVDNACNGLSTHPGGALQEYLDHKQAIATLTTALVEALTKGLTSK